MRYVNCIVVFCVLFFFIPIVALAGSLDDPGAPTSTDSAMYTLEDIYNRLNAGTAGAKRSGAFTEPSSGPGSTGHTTDEIMGKAPSVDDTDGAGAADVASGKTFWGLKSEEWGLKTGTGTIATAPAPVAKTGQATSYADYDDGYYEKGVSWPTPRWTCYDGNKAVVDCTTGSPVTATDNLTGLQWAINANLAGGTKKWYDVDQNPLYPALAYCESLSLGGFTDWRLPNLKELFSLIDLGQVLPAIPSGHPFTGVQSDNYWSSSSSRGGTSLAWCVYLGDGFVFRTTKTGSYYVWPVRGGQ